MRRIYRLPTSLQISLRVLAPVRSCLLRCRLPNLLSLTRLRSLQLHVRMTEVLLKVLLQMLTFMMVIPVFVRLISSHQAVAKQGPNSGPRLLNSFHPIVIYKEIREVNELVL